MRLTSRHELVFVSTTITHRGVTATIPDVLVDTGAASTVINADFAADAGIYLEPTDLSRRLRDVGGHEHVFARSSTGLRSVIAVSPSSKTTDEPRFREPSAVIAALDRKLDVQHVEHRLQLRRG